MTQHESILEAFSNLGDFFKEYVAVKQQQIEFPSPIYSELDEIVVRAKHYNGWFTETNMLFAIQSWSEELTSEKLNAWVSAYKIAENTPKTIALIMAGNIPLVGFHDFLAVLITGNSVVVKQASSDQLLLPLLTKFLISVAPILESRVEFTKTKLENFDAIIATGSNNTARYFEHYFGKYQHIIRRNRNSVALLTGKETAAQLHALGEDIFRYYGLGCRSVSKVFVPKGYDFDSFFNAIFPYANIADSAKYANNYDYNKAVYLMSEFKLLENGFLILKEDESYTSPIASLFYETYSTLETLKKRIEKDKEQLQCIVASGVLTDEIPFGTTQKPSLRDYADGVDTVEFLLKTSQI